MIRQFLVFLVRLRFLLPLIFQLALASCATGTPMYFHTFSFDTRFDAKTFGQPDVDVLDYAYGGSQQFGTFANKEYIALGHNFPQDGISGFMPRGEYLYVKWRVKETGEIYEDKVDLTHKIPVDVTGLSIHFLIDKSQLYVFLLPPSVTWSRDIYYKEEFSEFRQKHQIYPD